MTLAIRCYESARGVPPVRYHDIEMARTLQSAAAVLFALFAGINAQSSCSSAPATSSSAQPVYTSTSVPVVGPNSTDGDANYTAPYFPLLGFQEYPGNPILSPNPGSGWESAYLFNPAAIVIDDKVWLLYRAQNLSIISTIGLAWSEDGYNFTRYTQPVVYPTEPYEV